MKKISILAILLIIAVTNFAQKQLTNEDIWFSYKFFPSYIDQPRSMNDGIHFSALEKKGIVKYAYEKYGESSDVLLSVDDVKFNGSKISIDAYDFNADETKMLIATNKVSIYRRSWEANYYIVDLKTKEVSKLTEGDTPQRLAAFSPDGKKVAFVKENNLFIKDLSTQKETQITSDGAINEIINGTTDWVYEEEFAITKGFYWSPDSKKIAFYRFDESEVKEFTMKYYGDLYPLLYEFKYPKAGEDNSKVSIHIYNVADQKSKKCDIGTYEYIPRIKWSQNPDQLCVLTMNRHQSNLKYHMVNAQDFSSKIVYEEQSETYVEIDDNLIFLEDGKSFIRTSEKDGYNHIYRIFFDGEETQITKGKWDVVEFKGVDQEKGLIYYTSAEEGPIYKSLYVVNLKGKKKEKLSEKKGTNDAKFSNGMKYYINTYSNANTPSVYSLHKANGALIKVIEANDRLNGNMEAYKLSPKEFFTIKGAEKELNAWMIKPVDFDESKQYPVFMHVYGGPGNNTVEDAWGGMEYFFHQMLAQNGYIVVSVDPRGTMYRGEDFKKCTYLQLGKLETEDVIAVAQKLGERNYIDADRIGIQGWSYGGYLSSLAITKGADVFAAAIAIAPVTNWRFYDNIYTERFMRTPQENAKGYDDNSPINHAEKLEDPYLIVHGGGDDNVHVQNTLEMTDALVAANKSFDMFIYPNRNHGIYGGTTRVHLFEKMWKFIKENI